MNPKRVGGLGNRVNGFKVHEATTIIPFGALYFIAQT